MSSADASAQGQPANIQEVYSENLEKYFEYMLRSKKDPTNPEVKNGFEYMCSNIDYLEDYMAILALNDKEEIEKRINRLKCIKELIDAWFDINPESKKPLIRSDKIEMV